MQLLVVGLESPAYDGTVLEELGRLREAGVVRLVDLVVVRHEPDVVGSLTRFPGQVRLVDHAAGMAAVWRVSNSCGDSIPRLEWRRVGL